MVWYKTVFLTGESLVDTQSEPLTEISIQFKCDVLNVPEKVCTGCNNTGFSGNGTGYDSVCDECGGQSAYP